MNSQFVSDKIVDGAEINCRMVEEPQLGSKSH